jgi:hypothetical protein
MITLNKETFSIMQHNKITLNKTIFYKRHSALKHTTEQTVTAEQSLNNYSAF